MSSLQSNAIPIPLRWSSFKEQRGGRVWREAPGWLYSWLVYWSEQWTVLRILDAAGKFVIVIAVVQWFLEAGSRTKERHYRAWQIVNSARGAPGDGGRLDALQDLNSDGVSLADAPLSNAYLISIKLPGATLSGAALSEANLIEANLSAANLFLADLTGSNLARANLEGANLSSAKLINANLVGANLSGATLVGANLIGANLLNATLFKADISQAILEKVNFCGTVMPDGTINNFNCRLNSSKP